VNNGCPSSSIAIANVNNVHHSALRQESCHDGIRENDVVLSPSTIRDKRNQMDVASYEELIATLSVALDDVKKKLIAEEERRKGVEDELKAINCEIVKLKAQVSI